MNARQSDAPPQAENPAARRIPTAVTGRFRLTIQIVRLISFATLRWRATMVVPTLAAMEARIPFMNVPDTDPAMTRVVTASNEEIRLAQELRRQIELRYLGRSDSPGPYCSVGAD